MPALFTRMSIRPARESTESTNFLHLGFDGEIGNEGKNSLAAGVEFAGAGMNAIRRGSNHHAHSRRMQSSRDSETNSFGASRAGNDRCLSV
jgi:hypothetical protein